MMRARTNGVKKPCAYCGALTVGQWDDRAPSGRHLRFVDCCFPCGEDSARRVHYLKLKEGAAA